MEPSDELLEAVYRLFGNNRHLQDALPKRAVMVAEPKSKFDAAEPKIQNETEKLYAEFQNIKDVIRGDPTIQAELTAEFQAFCKKLLDHIVLANHQENLMDRLFVGKLIEYISHSGHNAVISTRTVKYLLTAFTQVIDMVQEAAKDDKEKKKAVKTILVIF